MIMNMKTYINAELQIVRMNNNDIVTTSTVGVGTPFVTGTTPADAPGRRRSIWD